MHFEQLLAQAAELGEGTMQFPANWCQGRTAFGGLSTALMYQAIRQHVSGERRILSLSTNFVAPLLAEQDFQIKIEILREGKNSSQVMARIVQNQQVCVITQACFGAKRASNVHVEVAKEMTLSPVNEQYQLPYQKGVMPEFFQHVALCPQQGALPFSGADTSHLGGWMRFKEEQQQMNEAHIIALTDAWPPTLLQMYKQPAPASSMSWYLEFVQDPDLKAQDWLGFEAETHYCKDGYGIEDGTIWSSDGKLLALTRQTVALFD